MAISIQEVAERAGVSKAMVSMALKGHPKVSEMRRRSIRQLAEKMGYRPNRLAQSLTTGKTQTIGFMQASIYLEVSSKIITMAELAAKRRDYRIFGTYSQGDVDMERRDLEELLARKVDGIIGFPAERCDCVNYRTLLRNHLPFVILGMEAPFPCHTVRVDFEEGARLTLQHLLAVGRRRFAFLLGGTASYAVQARIKGWRQVCREAGLDFDAFPLYEDPMNASPETAWHLAQRLLTDNPPVDSIVASNDIFALVAMNVLNEAGRRVPDDVAVTGFDDNAYTPYLPIPLTTVRQPTDEVGELSVKLLFEQIENPGKPVEQIVLKPQLVVRASTVGRGRHG